MKRLTKPMTFKPMTFKPMTLELDHEACYRAVASAMPASTAASSPASRPPESIAVRSVRRARRCRKNVIFFPSAAAAQEAGFRPCLRCRPETAPDLGAWRGTSNTVSRALSLIEHGALDEADVDALAGRLGVGERQLRRLFRSISAPRRLRSRRRGACCSPNS